MPDESNIDEFVQRLIAMITVEGNGVMTKDPVRFMDALMRANVQHHLSRLTDMTRDTIELRRRVAITTTPPAAHPAAPPFITGAGNGTEQQHDSDPLSDLTVQHLSTIREIIVLLFAIEQNGGATFAMVKAATAPFWKGETDESARDKALRTQISRMGDYITSRGDGTYRITDLGRKRLIERCDFNSGLIRRVRPDIIESAKRIRDGGDLH